MKIHQLITGALATSMLGLLGMTSTLAQQEDTLPACNQNPVSVQAKGIKCSRSVLWWDGREKDVQFVADFQVGEEALPAHNRYTLKLGPNSIASSDLATPFDAGASWAIVVDISDPSGRPNAINMEKLAMASLHTFMSRRSKVEAYALSRELRGLKMEYLGGRGLGIDSGYFYETKNRRWAWTQNGKRMIDAVFEDIPPTAMANTYLWIGLTKVLREKMPEIAKNEYRNLPKGIILLSDGVDESSTTNEDLAKLVQEAKEAGVVIHTVGVPNKDHANTVKKHRGYSALQRLAVETGGIFISYEDCKPHELQNMIKSTETHIARLRFPLAHLIPGDDMTLALWNGTSECKGTLTVNQYEIAKVAADCYMRSMQNTAKDINRSNSAKDTDYGRLGYYLLKNLQPLPVNREELAKYSDADEPFVNRTRQILTVLDAHPEIIKEELARVANNEETYTELMHQIGVALCNFSAPLPTPPDKSQDTIVNVNTTNNTGIDELDQKEVSDEGDDWLWWSVGIGGVSLIILIFCLLIKSLLQRGGNAGGAAPTPRTTNKQTLATLVNKKNPAQFWRITSASCRVGRKHSNEVVIPETFVSGTHFLLTRDGSGQWKLSDNHSTNGTMLNGKKVDQAHLQNGDVIRVADLELEFKI